MKTEQKGKLIKINIKDIIFIEGLKNYVKIHARSGEKIIALLNMKDLEERLPAGEFVRTHKSFLLATGFIRMIEGTSCTWTIPKKKYPWAIPTGSLS